MKRKDYQKPTMKIVKLRHTGMLMTSDGLNASRGSYSNANKDLDTNSESVDESNRWVWN